MQTDYSLKNSYDDNWRGDIEFEEHDKVYKKISYERGAEIWHEREVKY